MSILKRRELLEAMGAGAAALLAQGVAGCAAERGDGAGSGARDRERDAGPAGHDAGPAQADCPPAVGVAQAGTDAGTAGRPSASGEQVAMLVFPGLTLMDLVAPQTAFYALGMQVPLVWKDLRPVVSDSGVSILPTTTLEDCPRDLDVLFVGGSLSDTASSMGDAELLDLLRDRGERAKLITSVCTGSLILGAAGLLRGHRATSHWVTRHLLSLLEAEPVDQRVVVDGNRITAAGVTAGIELGLHVGEQLRGPSEDLSVSALASRVNMSVRNFSRSFRRECGMTPAAYVEAARLDTAERKLELGRASVEEIARDVGFGSASSMRRAFGRRGGEPPSALRRSASRAARDDPVRRKRTI